VIDDIYREEFSSLTCPEPRFGVETEVWAFAWSGEESQVAGLGQGSCNLRRFSWNLHSSPIGCHVVGGYSLSSLWTFIHVVSVAFVFVLYWCFSNVSRRQNAGCVTRSLNS